VRNPTNASRRWSALALIVTAQFMVILDVAIVNVALPSIKSDLGFSQANLQWVISAYAIMFGGTLLLGGRLADLLGRRRLFTAGLALFAGSSLLCGLAWSEGSLIAFRALQGLGAGAVQPMAMTIIGDLYTVAERAKVQGYVASVWASSSVVGPTLGGLFVDFADWRWIFFINVPLGAVAAWFLARRFHERVEQPTRPKLDLAGAGLLTVGSTLLILALLQGGVSWAWSSAPSLILFGLSAALLVAFVLVERRAAEPVLPGWVFRNRLLNATNLASLAVGVMLIGLVSYIPLYAQGVLGTSALVGGFAVAALTLGWPLAASTAGRIYLRIGFRATALIGAVILVGAAVMLWLISPESSVLQLAATSFVVGLGLGLVAAPTLIAAQSAVDWSSRGVVTGTNMFARSIGSALGIAAFGAIANASLSTRIGGHATTLDGVPPEALDPALHQVFVGSAVVAALLLLAVAIMPRTPALGADGS
jgi:EmrB/QacA subfamily drug resistance transporter